MADYGILDEVHSSALGQIVRQLTEFEMTADLTYEQILYPLLAGVRGAVAPVAQMGGADGQLWTFTPQALNDPAPDAFTLEYVERAGATTIQQITSTFGLCRKIRISASQAAEYAVLETEWFARFSESKAFTAAIGLPTRTIVPGPKFIVGFAATFAGLSAMTEWGDQIIGFEWELETGIAPKFRLDNASVNFATYQFGKRKATLKITLDLTAQAETERTTILQAAAARFIRASVVGPAIGASNYRINLDGAYQLLEPFESGSDTDGQSSVELEYTAHHDVTKGAPFEIVVQNTLAAIP
jgi:hypothetical protein